MLMTNINLILQSDNSPYHVKVSFQVSRKYKAIRLFLLFLSRIKAMSSLFIIV
jgi:hypothetical protein